MNSKQPKFAIRLLHWFCDSQYLEEVEGDLEEIFDDNLEKVFSVNIRPRMSWHAGGTAVIV